MATFLSTNAAISCVFNHQRTSPTQHSLACKLPTIARRRPPFTCRRHSSLPHALKDITGSLPPMLLTILPGPLTFFTPEKASAVENIAQISLGFWKLSPEDMYIVFTVEAIALIGAAVGGILARQRKEELERLNVQLRKINEYLRSKAMVETYAPGLVYAPVGRPLDERRLITEKEELTRALKEGKKCLREKNPESAYQVFKKALFVAQKIGDATEEKKAARGLGASCQRQGKYQEAITFHSLVLQISERTGETSGNTDALGAIADCYCELGDFDTARTYYNKYIDRLTEDDS